MDSDFVEWRIKVARFTPESGLRTDWAGDHRLRVRVLGDARSGHEVVIEGNAVGLESLARNLLTLAQDGVPSGTHSHLESATVLDARSAALVLERDDDVDEHER